MSAKNARIIQSKMGASLEDFDVTTMVSLNELRVLFEDIKNKELLLTCYFLFLLTGDNDWLEFFVQGTGVVCNWRTFTHKQIVATAKCVARYLCRKTMKLLEN